MCPVFLPNPIRMESLEAMMTGTRNCKLVNLFYCPVALPLALFLFSKAGSSSWLQWLMSFDGVFESVEGDGNWSLKPFSQELETLASRSRGAQNVSDVRWILTEWLDAVARRWRLWRSSEEQSQVALRSSAMEEAMRFLTENNESATPPFDIPETVAAYAAWTDRFIKIALPVAFCTNCCALGSRRLAVTVSRYVFAFGTTFLQSLV